jgi:hypothetical protein
MTKKDIDLLMKKFDLKVKTKYSVDELNVLKDLIKSRFVGGTRTLSSITKYIKENAKKDEPKRDSKELQTLPQGVGSDDQDGIL